MSRKKTDKDSQKSDIKQKRPLRRTKGEPGTHVREESKQISKRNVLIGLITFIIICLFAASYVHLSSPNIPEIDAFYHAGHAKVYAEDGIFKTEFPWVTYSIIKSYAADIWYGFHLILVPFSGLQDPLLRIKVPGIIILATMLILFFFAMRRMQLSYPFIWPFFLLFSASVMVWRFSMTRPHVITDGLAVLLLAYMVAGSSLGVFVISAAITFIHLSFFWIAILITVLVAIVKLRTEKIFEWKKMLAVLAGLTLGWLMRPNPLGAAKILYVQIFQLMFVKQSGALEFKGEITPLASSALKPFTLFMAIWLGLLLLSLAALLLRRSALSARGRTLFWCSSLLSILFFEMTMMLSKRTVDQWVPFGVIFIAVGFTYFIDYRKKHERQLLKSGDRKIATGIAVVFGLITVFQAFVKYPIFAALSVPPSQYKDTAEWLKNNAKEGEIVFHADAVVFPELFFWNPQNYYIGGMDPVFQYSYDPALYWKARHIADGDAVNMTWGSSGKEPVNPQETYSVLRNDFDASYLFIQKSTTPYLYGYARQDPRFEFCIENRASAVFRIVAVDEELEMSD